MTTMRTWASAWILILTTATVFCQDAPKTKDVLGLQERIRQAVAQAAPATVGVRLARDGAGGEGSGVIVSEDGLVMTAAHCFPEPGKKAWVVLPDGRLVEALTLGKSARSDAGMMKITEKGRWPFTKVADSADLDRRQLCLALGHPGGFNEKRRPVIRLGTVLGFRARHGEFLRTTCVVRPGDSGGPIVNLDGHVIGINSNISRSLRENYHVPSAVYLRDWQALVDGKDLDAKSSKKKSGKAAVVKQKVPAAPPAPFLGLRCRNEGSSCRIIAVAPKSSASDSGLTPNDIVLSVDGVSLKTRQDLRRRVEESRVGDVLRFKIRRGAETLRVPVTLRAKVRKEKR